MLKVASLQATISGRVQGVFFRAFVHQRAIGLNLTGYVRNLPSGRQVEVLAEGEKSKLIELLRFLKQGPSAAIIENVETIWRDYSGKYTDFEIID